MKCKAAFEEQKEGVLARMVGSYAKCCQLPDYVDFHGLKSI